MEHLHFGALHFVGAEGVWLGKTPEGHELCIQGDAFEDRLDPACEALAARELLDRERLLVRLDAFLATAREPYLDRWAVQRWEVLSLVFRQHDGRPTFVAEYLLEGDTYTVWQMRVEDGQPVALGRR